MVKFMRVQTSRSNTGCQTCKLRHVKCDEKRPACDRCFRANRACFYANNNVTRAPVKFVVYTPEKQLSPSLQLPYYERRTLDHFHHRTLAHIQGPFRSEFWEFSIPLLIQHDPIVRHAIYALSTIHEQWLSQQISDSSLANYGLHYYQKSLRQLVKLDTPSRSFDSVLASCVVFYSFASLRGDFDEATRHAAAGLKMIASSGCDSNKRVITPKALMQVFLELQDQVIQANVDDFRYECPAPLESFDVIPPTFKLAEDALPYVQKIGYDVLDLSERAEALHHTEPWVASSISASMQPIYDEVRGRFDALSAVVSKMEYSMKQQSSNNRQYQAFLVLRIFLMSLSIDLEVFVHGETIYDHHVPLNLEILDLVHKFFDLEKGITHTNHTELTNTVSDPSGPAFDVLQTDNSDLLRKFTPPSSSSTSSTSSPSSNTPPPSTFSPPAFVSCLGLIPLLFEIATRTTNAHLRASTLHLLSTANRREGVWDSRTAARLAERIITLKEDGAAIAAATAPPPPADPSMAGLGEQPCGRADHPPECTYTHTHNKFIVTDIQLLSDQKCSVTYGFKRQYRHSCSLTTAAPATEQGGVDRYRALELRSRSMGTDAGGGTSSGKASSFQSFWWEGIGPGEGEVRTEIIDVGSDNVTFRRADPGGGGVRASRRKEMVFST